MCNLYTNEPHNLALLPTALHCRICQGEHRYLTSFQSLSVNFCNVLVFNIFMNASLLAIRKTPVPGVPCFYARQNHCFHISVRQRIAQAGRFVCAVLRLMALMASRAINSPCAMPDQNEPVYCDRRFFAPDYPIHFCQVIRIHYNFDSLFNTGCCLSDSSHIFMIFAVLSANKLPCLCSVVLQ